MASTLDRGVRVLGCSPNSAACLPHGLMQAIHSPFLLMLLPSPSEFMCETFQEQGKVLSVCICLAQGGHPILSQGLQLLKWHSA